jgi:hypothetical protein
LAAVQDIVGLALDVREELERAERYRSRAEKLRLLAQSVRAQEVRRALLGVARDYDNMAEMIEASEAKTNRARTPRR